MHAEEFMTMREIVNDILHRSHPKDLEIIKNSSLQTFQLEHHEFATHIRNFYLLHHPMNPLIHEQGKTPDEVVENVISKLWYELRNPNT